MTSFIRKVPTGSGATAVQIVHKRGRTVTGIEHIGSAHDQVELEVLWEAARQRLHAGQDMLDLREATETGGPVVAGTRSRLLWQVLGDAYARLGFDVLGDEAFREMVLARIIEPTSKADTIRVLSEIGIAPVSLRTLFRSLGRCQERDYRDRLSMAAAAHSARTSGLAAMVMYDTTTLHFEVDEEDALRRVGRSKEHRVDPQVQVGLLVDPSGFPLEVHLFEGNTAETTSLIPVLTRFQQRHGVSGMVVVADAGMLSASNLNALEDAGFWFIVGSRITKAPYDLADHFDRHGDHFADGQILESTRVMGIGAQARSRRIVYQYSFKRRQRDDRAINAQIARAEKITTGKAPVTRTRFLKISGADKQLDQTTIDRARQLAGLKGYVSNLPIQSMPADRLIGAYHDLWQVERSFRMTKSDLKARPVFHHQRDAIEAHITVVFAALAVARHLQDLTGISIKKLVRILRPLREVDITIRGQQLTAQPALTDDARQILDRLPPGD